MMERDPVTVSPDDDVESVIGAVSEIVAAHRR